jgi:hypothetical protein
MKKLLMWFLFLLFSIPVFSQDETLPLLENKHRDLGLRYTFSYNYRTLQNIVVGTYDYCNHNFFLGPALINILPPFGNPLSEYKSTTIGLNFGYRNYFYRIASPEIDLFGQFQFSVYPVTFSTERTGVERNTHLIFENTLAVGGRYFFNEQYSGFVGFGGGSPHGAFLIMDDFFFMGFFGIQRNF